MGVFMVNPSQQRPLAAPPVQLVVGPLSTRDSLRTTIIREQLLKQSKIFLTTFQYGYFQSVNCERIGRLDNFWRLAANRSEDGHCARLVLVRTKHWNSTFTLVSTRTAFMDFEVAIVYQELQQSLIGSEQLVVPLSAE